MTLFAWEETNAGQLKRHKTARPRVEKSIALLALNGS